MESTENRRKMKRKPLVSPLEIYTKDVRRTLGKGYVVDINEDGLGLVTSESLSLGEELLFNFHLPNGWKCDFFGKVIYEEQGVSSKAYGVQFTPGQGTFIFKIV